MHLYAYYWHVTFLRSSQSSMRSQAPRTLDSPGAYRDEMHIRRALAQRRVEIIRIVLSCFTSLMLSSPGTQGPKQVLLNDGNEPLDPSLMVFVLGVSFVLFWVTFYRLLDPPKAQICCYTHGLLKVFMLQKSHSCWWFLAFQKVPRHSMLVVLFRHILFMFFDLSASDFWKNIICYTYMHGLVKVPFFNVFVICHVFLFLFVFVLF